MSEYHKNCYWNKQVVIEDVVKCFRKNLKRKEFVQTTKELYTPVPNEVALENPVYRHYFNTYFLNNWKDRTDEEAKTAAIEYRKHSRETDDVYHLQIPNKSSRDYWIPDQYSPWKWGGASYLVSGEPHHDILFRKYFTWSENELPRRLRNQSYYHFRKRLSCRQPDYKIVIN